MISVNSIYLLPSRNYIRIVARMADDSGVIYACVYVTRFDSASALMDADLNLTHKFLSKYGILK